MFYINFELAIVSNFSVTQNNGTSMPFQWTPIDKAYSYTVYFSCSGLMAFNNNTHYHVLQKEDIAGGLIACTFTISIKVNIRGTLFEGERSSPMLQSIVKWKFMYYSIIILSELLLPSITQTNLAPATAQTAATTTQLMVVQSTTVISDDGCNTALLYGLIATSTLLALLVLINIFVLTMMLFKKKLTSKTRLFA